MTLQDLAIAILDLPRVERDKPAGVWPPEACPNASFVSITGLEKTAGGLWVISTGKPAISTHPHV